MSGPANAAAEASFKELTSEEPEPRDCRDDSEPDRHLQETFDRHAHLYDENRPKAVERRRQYNQRTARENIEDLCDEGTFVEYGSMVLGILMAIHYA